MRLSAALREARARLEGAGIRPEEAALDADLLARHVLGWDRATLVARLTDETPDGFAAAYGTLVARRLRREPMAYILGVQEFWGREFHVAPGVLIPRPETEVLVDEALAWVRAARPQGPLRIVDVGTGSGCLAVTLALELPGAQVEATDISSDALAIARDNARRLGASVCFHHGPVLAGVVGPLDLVVSNPPYVAHPDYEELQPEVRAFEPASALVAGADGLDVVRRVLEAAGDALAPGGRLFMEIGYGQADAVAQLVANAALLTLEGIRPDLQGTPRVAVAARVRHDPPP